MPSQVLLSIYLSRSCRQEAEKHVFYVCFASDVKIKHTFYECARILRVFCCSLCVLCRLEAPKARVLRVFCGLEEPGRSKGVLRERP